MAHALAHQYENELKNISTPAGSDAPTPWRAVPAYSELAAILDVNGHSVLLCRKEHAARIVAAVNAADEPQS